MDHTNMIVGNDHDTIFVDFAEYAGQEDTNFENTMGGLGGHCGAIEDEVLLEKREAGERSVTGRGPHISPPLPPKSERKEKQKGGITAGSFIFFEDPSRGLGHTGVCVIGAR